MGVLQPRIRKGLGLLDAGMNRLYGWRLNPLYHEFRAVEPNELGAATLPMADGDAWWHIHAGEEILATGQVPDTNTWTIAGEGFRWISQDWLSNVGMKRAPTMTKVTSVVSVPSA